MNIAIQLVPDSRWEVLLLLLLLLLPLIAITFLAVFVDDEGNVSPPVGPDASQTRRSPEGIHLRPLESGVKHPHPAPGLPRRTSDRSPPEPRCCASPPRPWPFLSTTGPGGVDAGIGDAVPTRPCACRGGARPRHEQAEHALDLFHQAQRQPPGSQRDARQDPHARDPVRLEPDGEGAGEELRRQQPAPHQRPASALIGATGPTGGRGVYLARVGAGGRGVLNPGTGVSRAAFARREGVELPHEGPECSDAHGDLPGERRAAEAGAGPPPLQVSSGPCRLVSTALCLRRPTASSLTASATEATASQDRASSGSPGLGTVTSCAGVGPRALTLAFRHLYGSLPVDGGTDARGTLERERETDSRGLRPGRRPRAPPPLSPAGISLRRGSVLRACWVSPRAARRWRAREAELAAAQGRWDRRSVRVNLATGD